MFRQMLRGPMIAFAPEDDEGFDPDLEADDLPDEELEDEADEDLDEPVDEIDDEQVDEPVRQPSRADNRVATATRAAKEAKDKADMLERQLADMQRQQVQQAQQNQGLTQAQIQERLQQMEPWERTEYFRQVDAHNTQQALQRMQFDQTESADKLAYDALASRVPAAAKLKEQVEARLVQMRGQGTTAPRETILKFLIGERAIENIGRSTGRAQRIATANRDRQTARPANARPDASAGSGRRSGEKAARDKRVADYQL